MSEIRDPAHTDDPTAPGDEGNTEQPSAGNQGASRDRASASGNESAPGNEARGNGNGNGNSDADADDAPMPGNEAPRGNESDGNRASAAPPEIEDDESPEDSIGNRIDGGPTHGGPPGAARGGQKPGGGGAGGGGGKQRRKGGGPQGGGGDRPRGPQGGGGGDPGQRRAFHVGDKVRAKIVSVGAAAVLVDLWGKERGVLDLREVVSPEGAEPRVGDGVDVVVVQDGTRGGNLVVTRDPSRAERGREMVAQAFNSNEQIEGLITGLNRGGLEVDLSGVRAFCPSSQIDARVPPSMDPKSLVLTRQLFKITSLLEDGREAVVSRRAIVEQAVRARAEEVRKDLKVGQTVKGIVMSVKDYGVFVDLGGIEGMIHISELTNNRSARPQDVVKVGEEVECKVLRISAGTPPESSVKEEPMATLAEESAPAIEVGEAIEGAPAAEGAVGVEGAEVAEGAPGAVAPGGPEGRRDDRKKGGRKQQQQQRRGGRPEGSMPRVALSRRALEADPWADFDKRLPVGSVHTGKVARMQPFGAFVELLPGVDGLLHVSELGDGRRLAHPNEVLKEGQMVTVRVDRIDRGAKRLSLSLLPEGVTEEQLKGSITPRLGMIVQAVIAEHESFGVWAQIEGTVGKLGRGLITPPESNEPRGTDLRKALPPGKNVKVKIVEIERGRPKLSIRAALQDEERQAYRAYQKEATSKTVGVSLADKLRAKLGGLAGGKPSGR